MKSWVARVQVPTKNPMWVGTYPAEDRNQAKREARRFVSSILPLDTQILSIAQGRIDVTLDGPEIPIDEERE
jgi:hypothetical protein